MEAYDNDAKDTGFHYLSQRLGVESAIKRQLDSPFDYESQAELVLVNRLPDPSSRNQYDRAVAEMLRSFVVDQQGRTMVLFTSHQALARASNLMKELLNLFIACSICSLVMPPYSSSS